jgi:hypothetical protein
VGTWAIKDSASAVVKVREVEEVMRSCGGAVQGIREPSDLQGEEPTSTYLNRANDGFVFFDDGSYTMGPLSIELNNGDNDKRGMNDEASFVSCLVLPQTDGEERKQRLTLSFGKSGGVLNKSGDSLLLPHTATMRTKRRFGDPPIEQPTPIDTGSLCEENSSSSSSSSSNDESAIPAAAFTIQEITRIVRCRMPSEGQPWMLQRSKWETLLPEREESIACDDALNNEDAGEMDNKENLSPRSKSTLLRWMVSEPTEAFFERLGTASEAVVPYSSESGGIVVQCGVACPSSRNLWLLAREYRQRSDGLEQQQTASLCGILRVEGKVRFDTD